MSDFLVELIPDMLKHLSENSMGYPYGYTSEGWEERLKTLEKKFRNITKLQTEMEDRILETPSSEWKTLDNEVQEAIKDAFTSLAEDFTALWD